MCDDFHGADRVQVFLDAPLQNGGTHRQRIAMLARTYLLGPQIAQDATDAGLDVDDLVAHVTGWRDH